MALKVKAVEKKVKFSKDDPGVWRYVMSPDLYIALSQEKVIKEAALRSGVSRGVMQACWDAAGEVIKAWATEGHSVALPGPYPVVRFFSSKKFGILWKIHYLCPQNQNLKPYETENQPTIPCGRAVVRGNEFGLLSGTDRCHLRL